jgi:hypothetical protein
MTLRRILVRLMKNLASRPITFAPQARFLNAQGSIGAETPQTQLFNLFRA